MVLVRDLSSHGRLRLTGKDRVRFLNGLVTNDVKALATGQGCHAGMLTVKGKLLGDMIVYAADEALEIDLPAEAVEKVKAAMDRYLVADDVLVEDHTRDRAALGVHGDGAAAALESALGASGLAALAPYQHLVAGGVRVAASHDLGLAGFRLYGEKSALDAIAARVGGTPLDEQAAEVLRVEAGQPRYGLDAGEDHLPIESRLEDTVSYNKGCFLGQEVIVRLRDQGHLNWRLVGLRLDGAAPAPAGSKLSSPARPEAGEVTSSVVSPRHGAIALAYVHRTEWAPGNVLTLRDPSGDRVATVAELPFTRRA